MLLPLFYSLATSTYMHLTLFPLPISHQIYDYNVIVIFSIFSIHEHCISFTVRYKQSSMSSFSNVFIMLFDKPWCCIQFYVIYKSNFLHTIYMDVRKQHHNYKLCTYCLTILIEEKTKVKKREV